MRAKIIASGIGFAVTLAASPALAHHHDRMDYPAYLPYYAPPDRAAFPVDRALAESCGLHAGSVHPYMVPAGYYDGYSRRRGADRDAGLGGLLIGGVAGGLIGNRVAGRGDRVLGTAAGATVGAIAGAAIDRAAASHRYDDRGPPPPGEGYSRGSANECDSVLPAGYMLVSVPGRPECRDEVITHEEWVPEDVTVPGPPIYERAPPRDKRIKLRRVK